MNDPKLSRVSVAITADGGSTICGFRSHGPSHDAGGKLCGLMERLRDDRRHRPATVVVATNASELRYNSLEDAARELCNSHASTLDQRPTMRVPVQDAPVGAGWDTPCLDWATSIPSPPPHRS